MSKEKRLMWAIVSSYGFADRIIYHKTFRAISEEEAQKIFDRGTYSRDFSDLGVNLAEVGNTITRIHFFETKKERDEYYNGIPSKNKMEELIL